jgi:hypothetical protein
VSIRRFPWSFLKDKSYYFESFGILSGALALADILDYRNTLPSGRSAVGQGD